MKKTLSLVFLLCASLLFGNIRTDKTQQIEPQNFSNETQIVSIVISKNTIVADLNIGESLYTVMQKSKQNGKLIFSGKEFPSLGFFVTDIENLHEGNGKYLFYSVNGKESTVGITNYYPKNNDIVEWKLQ